MSETHLDHADSVIDEAFSILLDPAHMIAELASHLIIEFILLGIAVPFIMKLVRRHDRIHHNHECG